MDDTRRLQGRRMLAIPIILIILTGILALALYESEGKKTQLLNAVAVVVTSPLQPEQKSALERRFQEYAAEDNRAPVSLKVYVVDPEVQVDIDSVAQDMNAGIPNLYLIESSLCSQLAAKVPLEMLDQRYPGDPAVQDGVFYMLSEKGFLQADGMSDLPELCLALQRSDTYAVTKDVQTQSYYAYQSQLLDNIAGNLPGEPI